MRDRSQRWFAGPRGPILLAAIALAFSLPALNLGLLADDRLFLTSTRVLHVADTELFTITAAIARFEMERGRLVWWTSENLSVRFMRPLASASHALEYRHYPDAPWLMHGVNVVLYALCVWVCAALYRRLTGDVRIAALAGLMFAIDEAHGANVGWISARNTLLAALFAFVALLCHVCARDAPTLRRVWLQVSSALCVALALASGESGISAAGLLVAYALTLGRDSSALPKPLLSIAPQLGVIGIWAIIYASSGFGVHGSSLYRELAHPFEALGQGLLDLPVWITSLFGPSLVNVLLAWPPHVGRLATLPIAAACLWILSSTIRRSRLGQFFALSAALTLAPNLATFPQDRLTVVTTFGTFGILAAFIVSTAGAASRVVRSARYAFLAIHIGLALLLFPLAVSSIVPVENATQAVVAAMPSARQVLLLNSPSEIIGNYAFSSLMLPEHADRKPNSLHTLYAGASDLEVTRVSANALEVRAQAGWGRLVMERIFCAKEDLPRAGAVRRVRDIDVEVLETTSDGRPNRVRFTFPTPLESPERAWLSWQGTAPVAWTPPPIGERIHIAGQNLLAALPK